MSRTVRAAVVQARPDPSDLSATLDKAASLIDDAAREGAELVALGEVFFPGYPSWLDNCPSAALWDNEPTKAVHQRLRENAVVVPSEATATLSRLAAELELVIVASVHERVERGPGHGTLYAALLTFDANGELVNHHRKLVPTYTERLVWGPGDGAGLNAPETAAGRVGGLICWEHWMPLARQAMHDQAEQIHVAVWPTVHDAHQLASRHYAFEGRCFVLAAGQVQLAEDLPPELDRLPELEDDPTAFIQRGGSAIYGPRGDLLAGPVFEEETVLVADLELDQIERETMNLDVTGHYYRDDVFDFDVHRRRR